MSSSPPSGSQNASSAPATTRGWCPPGRVLVGTSDGGCYCDAPQYVVKPPCLTSAPPCYTEDLKGPFTYYGQDTGAYITHGERRVDS